MKFDALLHKTRIKVLGLDMCTFMLSLSKTVHQTWHDHPFSQRNNTPDGAVWVCVGGNMEGGDWTKLEKREGGNIGEVFIKLGG